MLDLSWNNILHSNALNFIIMIAFFGFIAYKLKLSEAIEKNRASIQKSIEDSDLLKADSQEELKKVEKSLENLPNEIESILKNAEQTAKAFEAKTKADLERLVQSIKDNTEKQINAEEKHTNSVILQNAANASVEVAHKQVINALEHNKDLHRKFINDFINEIDGLEV